jgi:hypothetical protein
VNRGKFDSIVGSCDAIAARRKLYPAVQGAVQHYAISTRHHSALHPELALPKQPSQFHFVDLLQSLTCYSQNEVRAAFPARGVRCGRWVLIELFDEEAFTLRANSVQRWHR